MPYPFSGIEPERYAVNAGEPVCTETELPIDSREELRVSMILEGVSGNRGRALKPISENASAEVLKGEFLGSLQPYTSNGGTTTLQETSGFRGGVVIPIVPVGCDTELGEVVNGQLTNEEATRIIRYSRGFAFLSDTGSRGSQLAFRATGPCPNIIATPDEFGDEFYQYDVDRGPYPVDLFGQKCSLCPIVFATFDKPCLDCSYESRHVDSSHPQVAGAQCKGFGSGHRRVAFNWETREVEDRGKAHCIPNYFNADLFPDLFDPDFRMTCHIDPDTGAVLEHHCEECVHERLIGLIVNTVLEETDALSKVPLRAVRVAEGEASSVQGNHCRYDCGEFGFELWSSSASGLRIPNFLGVDILTAREEPTTCITIGDAPACIQPFNRGGFTELRWQSGFPLCGTALVCDCGDNIFCTTTHHFEWDKDNPGNKITDAWLCIKQHQLCDPIDPCSENPVQEEGGYNSPSSELIAWVDCGYTLELKIKHWGPNPNNLLGCGCCLFNREFEADDLTVRVKARFTGPVAWGNRGDGFNGYLLAGGRLYPEKFPDVPSASYPGVAGAGCANLFVDQGSYDDPLGQPFANPGDPGDPDYEPRKRCPSWFADDGSAKFFCPPWNQMTFEILGTRGSDWEDTSDIQPNKHERRQQCWAGQVIRNDGSGCSDGSIDARNPFDVATGCQDPECRRGCSIEESVDGSGQRISPWPESNGRVTPGGCSQCAIVYPPEPI